MGPPAFRIQLTRAQTFHQLPANSFSSGTDQFDWAGGVPVFSGACRIIINNEFLYRSSSILSPHTGKGCTIPDEKVRPLMHLPCCGALVIGRSLTFQSIACHHRYQCRDFVQLETTLYENMPELSHQLPKSYQIGCKSVIISSLTLH